MVCAAKMLPVRFAGLIGSAAGVQEGISEEGQGSSVRAKEVSGKNRQKPQQAQHEVSFTCLQAKVNGQFISMIRGKIGILERRR
jgi:hypothetical protein